MDTPRALLSTKDVTSGSRLLTLLGIVVVIASLYFGRQVLIPLALAVVLAFLLTPIVGLVERCRLGRVPSVLQLAPFVRQTGERKAQTCANGILQQLCITA
jgi:hypothetical protein